jgi:mono/diheme cytochrome c family protein
MARRRWKKILGITLIVIITLVIVGITFTIGWRPIIGAKKRALTDRKFEMTPARLTRGKYLVDGVMGCFGCHTDQDWSKPGAPPVAGREGSGHIWSDQEMPWLIAPNITPDTETGIGNWSDDTLARAIREGIGHDGRALFPLMPYPLYRQMSDEDLASVIVYVRSVPAVRNQLPTTKMPFPLSLFIKNVPEPVTAAVPAADQSTPVARAKGDVVSANITPAPSGLGYYSEGTFVMAMRMGKVGARPLHASMPWYFYGRMNDEDLKSIFAYLKTLKPVKHQLDNTEPPTFCRLCKQKHGFGATN